MNNKNEILYKVRLIFAGVVFALALLGIQGIFYPVKLFDIQFLPLLQRVIVDFSITAAVLLILLIAVTFIFGRIYCSLVCPFGIFQEIIGFIKQKFSKSSRQVNFPLKYFVAAVVWGIFLGGTALGIRYVEPYSLFGAAQTLSVTGIAAIVLVIAAIFVKDRIFCTNFCPVGTILGLISKVSPNKIYISDICVSCGMCERNCPSGCINSREKTVDNETCIKCLKCLSVCPQGGIKYGIQPAKKIKFSLKRRQLIIAGAALAVFGGMIKAGIELKDKVVEKLKDVILPAGAGNKEDFLNRCINCNLCVSNCPNKIIKKADSSYNAVHLDYSEGFCKFDCHKCSQVCPSGAIKKISLEEKQKTRIGMAMINEDKCSKCGLCAFACPVHAIIIEEGKVPVLNAVKCIGCGACKNACRFNAIEIFGVNEQRTF